MTEKFIFGAVVTDMTISNGYRLWWWSVLSESGKPYASGGTALTEELAIQQAMEWLEGNKKYVEREP